MRGDPKGPATARTDDGRSATTGDLPAGRFVPFAWPLFIAVWILFPVAFVIRNLFSGMSLTGAIVLVVSMSALVALFVLLMVRYPFPHDELTAGELRVRLVLLTALLIMCVYVEAAFASGIPWRLMYVVVAAGAVLQIRKAIVAVVGVTVLAGVLAVVRYGWAEIFVGWSTLVPFLLIGLGMIAVNRLAVTVRELHEAREEIARLAVSEERLRFARDLHDLLGHSLSLITLKSELAGRLLSEAPERAASEVHDIEDVAREALREVREAVTGYRKPTLPEELAGAREMLDAADIEFHLYDTTGDLDPATAGVLAWTVREGVTNVIRHSNATRCRVAISATDAGTLATITDDGDGPVDDGVEENSCGSGLSGLSERVRALGGDFSAGRLDGGGFRLKVEMRNRVSGRASDRSRVESGG